jgi:hypothetical protein
MRALVIALVVASPAVALAQAPGEMFAPPPIDTPPAIDAATRQPLADRAFFTGTALTTPSGTADVSGRVAIGAGYLVDVSVGLGRGTELWLEGGQTTTPLGSSPFAEGSGPVYDTQAIGLKQVLARGSRWQVAAEVSLRRTNATVYEAPVSSPNADYFVAGTLYASACFDVRCRVAITAAGALIDDLGSSSGTMPLLSASANVGGDHLRGLAEVLATPDQASGTIRSMLLLGARYGWTHLAIEGGLAFGTDDEDAGTAPFLGVSARI